MSFHDVYNKIARYLWIVPLAFIGGYAIESLTRDSSQEAKPNINLASIVAAEEKHKLKNKCDYDYAGWDKKEMENLIRNSETSQVTMFGIDHGDPYEPGDKRDGEFVANLLPHYKNKGFKYIAIEGPHSLNKYLNKNNFEKQAKEIFRLHWAEFGPVIKKARALKMPLVFYDIEKFSNSFSEREKVIFDNLKRMIFNKKSNSKTKVIFYCGAKHLHKEPVEVSFLNPERVKTIGCYLHDVFGNKLTTVYLQPEETRVSFFFNHSFYLGKQGCGKR